VKWTLVGRVLWVSDARRRQLAFDQGIASQQGLTLRDHLRASVADQAVSTQGPDGKPPDLDTFLDEAVLAIEALIAEEKALYKRMGLVSDAFAICEVGSRFDDRLTGEQLGWGFSIADMGRLGLPPVSYEGDGRYEESPAFQRWLILLTPEDCTP
jgi:hypothetical protein